MPSGSSTVALTVIGDPGRGCRGVTFRLLIRGGKLAAKLAFTRPGVPAGFWMSSGKGEADQLSALSLGAPGVIRSREEECPLGATGHGSPLPNFTLSIRRPSAPDSSMVSPRCFNDFLNSPPTGTL